MKKLTLGLVVVTGIACAALAQDIPKYEETGVIAMTVGSEVMTHYTTWTTVSGDPERQIHTASWLILESIIMAGVKLSTDDVHVMITSYDTVSPNYGQPTMRVEFGLDPVTLELNPELAVNLIYSPTGSDVDGYYALTNGQFEIESVTRIDDNTLAIIATAEGELSGQKGAIIDHNPNDILPISARFDLQKVVNRGDVPLP